MFKVLNKLKNCSTTFHQAKIGMHECRNVTATYKTKCKLSLSIKKINMDSVNNMKKDIMATYYHIFLKKREFLAW